MASLNKLVVNLSANTAKFDQGMKRSQSSLRKMTKAVAGLASAYVGLRSAKAALNLARTQAQAEKVLAATLNATGHAAGFTIRQLKDYASQLQKVTNFSDETTLSAMAILATFKNIEGDMFKDAVAIAQDMSTVFGTDLKASITQVGKAFDDPIKGVTALKRVGVSMSIDEMERIKRLQKMGDLIGAQAIIMTALHNQVGGAARAAADDVTQLGNAWSDLGETAGFALGAVILPHMDNLTSVINESSKALQIFGLYAEFVSAVFLDKVADVAGVWSHFTMVELPELTRAGMMAVVDIVVDAFRAVSVIVSNSIDNIGTSMLEAMERWNPEVASLFMRMWDLEKKPHTSILEGFEPSGSRPGDRPRQGMPDIFRGWAPGEVDNWPRGGLGSNMSRDMAGWSDAIRGNLEDKTIQLQNGLAIAGRSIDDLEKTNSKLAARRDAEGATAPPGGPNAAAGQNLGEFAWGLLEKARERIGEGKDVETGKTFAGAMAQGTQDAYSAIINATGNKQTEKMGQIVKNGDEANGTLRDILKAIETGGTSVVASFGVGF